MINLTAANFTPQNVILALNQLDQKYELLRSMKQAAAKSQSLTLEGTDLDVDTIILREWLSSPTFISGFDGSGFKLEQADGKWRLTIDELWVRKIMHLYELQIQQIKAQGGTVIISPAAGSAKVVQMTAVETAI